MRRSNTLGTTQRIGATDVNTVHTSSFMLSKNTHVNGSPALASSIVLFPRYSAAPFIRPDHAHFIPNMQ